MALIAAGLSLVTGGAVGFARVQSQRATEHKADADAGWAKADARALQLPPPPPKES